jgi:hypothetical protein
MDNEAKAANIDFVKFNDQQLTKQYGVFALPALMFF